MENVESQQLSSDWVPVELSDIPPISCFVEGLSMTVEIWKTLIFALLC
jgi:hypothetical protein